MQLSVFGEKFAARSGISGLMDDLGAALVEDPSLLFMGGGNPGRVDAAQTLFAQRLSAALADSERRHRLLGVYQAPQGDAALRAELARFLHNRFGWQIGAEHIAVSNGSQSAFFLLYNLFAGTMPDGTQRQIHLPLCPEYVGYRDIGLSEDFFTSTRPSIEQLGDGQFKYHVALDDMALSRETAALCVSRPANPTGNVVTDAELAALERTAATRDIPLIIDGAYGQPFPGLIYEPVTPFWTEQCILVMSLSKLGLPGVRTGIIVARPDIAQAFARANTVASLACGNLGPEILQGMFDDGSLMQLCEQQLQGFYRERRDLALRAVEQGRGDLPVWVHRPEGAFFLWLWCENLPIDSRTLYQRLKARGVIVLPGNDFFVGASADWRHSRECLRLSYAGDPQTIEAGIALVMDELQRAYREH